MAKAKSRAEKKLPANVIDNRPLFWARRPIQYGQTQLDRGAIMRLAGKINDEKLVRLGYLAPLPEGHESSECGDCGTEYYDSLMRDGHVKLRHRPAIGPRVVNIDDLNPAEKARMLSETLEYETQPPALIGDLESTEQQEKRLEQVAPLYVEKSKASQRA